MNNKIIGVFYPIMDDFIEKSVYEFVRSPDSRSLQNMEGHKARTIKYPNTRRNDPCPCGSGKKFKRCCINKVEASDGTN
ncbi:MAG: SEC-C metal-binding domain-containing protein [Syntrophomonas sp.]